MRAYAGRRSANPERAADARRDSAGQVGGRRLFAALATTLLLTVSVAPARECNDAPDKTLLYLALDTMLENPGDTFAETAVTNYRFVIDNGVPEQDAQAIDLACTLLARMLLTADQLETRSKTYAGCPGDPAAQAVAARMVTPPAGAAGTYSDYLSIARTDPKYPGAAPVNAIVVVQYSVSTNGNVTSERVIASSDKRFDRSALRNVRGFDYQPRLENGIAVESTGVLLTVGYRLEGDDSPYTRETHCE